MDDDTPAEFPYTLPGTQPAPGPRGLPGQPLTAARAAPLIAKVIG